MIIIYYALFLLSPFLLSRHKKHRKTLSPTALLLQKNKQPRQNRRHRRCARKRLQRTSIYINYSNFPLNKVKANELFYHESSVYIVSSYNFAIHFRICKCYCGVVQRRCAIFIFACRTKCCGGISMIDMSEFIFKKVTEFLKRS